MPFLWSNPIPDEATSAKLSAGYKVDAANIGPVVAAILAHRDREAAAANQQNQQMMQGIQSAIGAIAGGMEKGKQDDAANAALYGHFYPNDAQSAFTDPGRVPDYGGVDALKMQQIVAHLKDPQLQEALLRSQINSNNALANNRWTYPPGTVVSPSTQIAADREDRLEANDELKHYGIDNADLFDSSRHSRGSFKDGKFTGDEKGDTFRIMGTDNVPHYLPTATFDQLKQRAANSAATNYRTPRQTASVSQNDVEQAAGVMGRGERGEPIEGSTTSSTTTNRANAGPPQEAIADLLSNPSLATQFDQKYGQGMAAQFLGTR